MFKQDRKSLSAVCSYRNSVLACLVCDNSNAGCLQLLEILEISLNFIDAPGKFNCQLKYANL